MKKFGLIGNQISYSQSPYIHKRIADHFSYDISYELLECDLEDIEKYIAQLKTGLYDGFNVTKPFKEVVMNFLEEISPKAVQIGAVNTIYLKDGKIYGDNTDYDGFVYLLKSLEAPTNHLKTYILGSGGSAKACYAVLKDLGFNATVVSRTTKHQAFDHVISYDSLKDEAVDLYINAVTKDIDIFETYHIKPRKETLMIDINYSPLITKPMQYFTKAINGIDMLIVQAIKSQSLWFNQEFVLSKTLINEIKAGIL